MKEIVKLKDGKGPDQICTKHAYTRPMSTGWPYGGVHVGWHMAVLWLCCGCAVAVLWLCCGRAVAERCAARAVYMWGGIWHMAWRGAA